MPKSNHASRPVLHAALMTADIAASPVAVMVSASSRDRRFISSDRLLPGVYVFTRPHETLHSGYTFGRLQHLA